MLDEELPPADPVFGWECNFCSFQNRCGKAAGTTFGDEGVTGFLLGFTYPYEKVETYLESHAGAKLTPTLAASYPDLAEQYGVYDWRCGAKSHTFEFDSVEWDGDSGACPVCPSCVSDGVLSELNEPGLKEQGGAFHDDSEDESS